MKRISKIIVLFLTFVGLVGAIFYCAGGLGSGGDWTPKKSDPVINRYSAKMDSNWSKVDVWDKSVYDNNRDLLYCAQGELDAKYYATLLDYNTETALDRLDSALMKEFSKKKCDENILGRYSKALTHIKKCDGKWAKDARMQKMEGTYNLYSRIKNFCRKNVNMEPNFDISKSEWADFNKHKQDMLSEKKKLMGSPYYKYLKNNGTFSKKFNDLKVELDIANKQFVKSLVDDIIEQYNQGKSELSDADLQDRKDSLKKVQNEFNRLYFSEYNVQCTKLNDFVLNY